MAAVEMDLRDAVLRAMVGEENWANLSAHGVPAGGGGWLDTLHGQADRVIAAVRQHDATRP